MRTLIRKAHDLWCIVTHRCRVPMWTVDELKREDPVFASHMDWMEGSEHGARKRRRQNFMEAELLHTRKGGQRDVRS